MQKIGERTNEFGDLLEVFVEGDNYHLLHSDAGDKKYPIQILSNGIRVKECSIPLKEILHICSMIIAYEY